MMFKYNKVSDNDLSFIQRDTFFSFAYLLVALMCLKKQHRIHQGKKIITCSSGSYLGKSILKIIRMGLGGFFSLV